MGCLSASAQYNVTWQDLSKVRFESKYFPAYDEHFSYPHFSNSVKELDGRMITVTGCFLNIDPERKLFILSKGPMSSCFFCGVGGPEIAIELQFKTKSKYRTDDIVSVTGVLKLNSDDVEHFIYILTNSNGEFIN